MYTNASGTSGAAASPQDKDGVRGPGAGPSPLCRVPRRPGEGQWPSERALRRPAGERPCVPPRGPAGALPREGPGGSAHRVLCGSGTQTKALLDGWRVRELFLRDRRVRGCWVTFKCGSKFVPRLRAICPRQPASRPDVVAGRRPGVWAERPVLPSRPRWARAVLTGPTDGPQRT